MLLENSGEISPEGMKRLSQSKNSPVVDVSGGIQSDAVQKKTARNLEC